LAESGFDTAAHGLSFRSLLPISWRLVDTAGSPGAGADLRNLDVVSKLMAIENGAADSGPVEQECSTDIRRLHLKMDFLIGLVSDLIAGNAPQPEARQVMVCPDSVEWYDREPPETGAEIEVALYLSAKYPLPLRLRATVECVVKAGEQWMVSATWATMMADLAEAFERLIFLHHRREVARAASAPGTPPAQEA
jgi:hypothetical protein